MVELPGHPATHMAAILLFFFFVCQEKSGKIFEIFPDRDFHDSAREKRKRSARD
jgi:hypothetical protein